VLPFLRHPTEQQGLIWLKRRQRVKPSQLASELKVSRPFISKAQRIAETRINQLLRYSAAVNRLLIKQISSKHGFALCYSPSIQGIVYLLFSPTIGVQAWFPHKGSCSNCEAKPNCTQILKRLAQEWQLLYDESQLPTNNAKHLFDKIQEELGWAIKD
jgi:hypothetical protein